MLEPSQPSSSRKTTEGGRTRASFVEYVSEVVSLFQFGRKGGEVLKEYMQIKVERKLILVYFDFKDSVELNLS